MNNETLLSICIPTYNRVDLLEKTILSIVSDSIFLNTNLVEIIVSDNCSTDNTGEVCSKYAQKFPDKFFYYRNEYNIGGDKNILKSLSYGKGKLLKLNNDYCFYIDGALEKILNIILKNIDEKNVLFFSNSLNKSVSTKKSFICNSLDEFVSKVSHRSTWIGAFSIWKSDYDKLKDIDRYVDLGLAQTDTLLRLLKSGRSTYVSNEPLFHCPNVKRSGYNPAEVFGQNYLCKLLKPYVEEGLLNSQTYEREKKKVLVDTIIPFYFDFDNQNNFNSNDFVETLKPIYKEDFYFYYYFHLARINKLLSPITVPFVRIKNILECNMKIFINTVLKRDEKITKYNIKLAYNLQKLRERRAV